ncbi:cell division protein FtsA [Microaerobacter geothermalis]|uniref:cell division protein FtsA n=1 Tax=Microaerobacter geothermalis TaxID=674972 RepID=UPI001F32E147|nr:cell division protein FtsA [Microaerobacter geothermalis]MCF6094108.1 cell division protein FtsA [Microaerobacter geothermalis]
MSTGMDRLFALDIGTRSVVGLVLERKGTQQFKVLGCEIEEHNERSMLDGQIHDVIAVASVIQKVKNQLEKKLGPLSDVAVAAAGRSLKTTRSVISKDIKGNPIMNKDDVLTLELSAVQQAQAQLAKEEDLLPSTQYYCVGYSVVNYKLDGEIIGNLIDQRGNEVSIEVIATFLPRVVVDSLLAALERASLKMKALTLEPIAAINVLIPPSMRKLNIALVDIGAGTSDIAITSDGTITAYGMVPVAGDEITESISQAYLLDFPVAEKLKRQIQSKDVLKFVDILGMEHHLKKDEMLSAIEKDVLALAKQICQKIIELNGKAPQAVMLVGGGSQTPLLPGKMAEILGLPESRVAVRGADAIQSIIGKHRKLQGPEAITPIGIAVAAEKHPIKYMTYHVNGAQIRVFDLRPITVGEALLYSGLDMRKLHGKPGMALSITVNGKIRIIPGEHGTPPVIEKNGVAASLDETVQNGDQMTVEPGRDGKDASATLKDFITEIDTLDVFLDDKPVSVPPLFLVNGSRQELSYSLQDRDEVTITFPNRLLDVLEHLQLYSSDMMKKNWMVTVNGKTINLYHQKVLVLLNGKEVPLTVRVRQGDRIHLKKNQQVPLIGDILKQDEWNTGVIHITFNGEPLSINNSNCLIKMNGKAVSIDTPIEEGANIVIETVQKPAIFSDVFRYVEIESPEIHSGKKMITLVNQQPARFDTEIKTGDVLELRWE